MKSAKIVKYGSSGAIEISDVSQPDLSGGQVLVQVLAAGVNPADWKIRAGYMAKMLPQLPFTPGGDFAGVVKTVGPGVTGYQPGDEVYGQASIMSGGSGSFAQLAVANISHIARKPDNLDFVSAGSLPLAGVSAIQAITDQLQLEGGEKILIHGAGGGIGSIAVQIASEIGAEVTATAGTKDLDFVKSLGAVEVIDYKTRDFSQILSGFDAVFDTVGGETYKKSFMILKKGGKIVSMLEAPDPELMEKYGVTASLQMTKVDTLSLEKLTGLLETGDVKINIDKIFPLDQADAALTYVEKDHPRGKVVLRIE
jgi:NADPH:quinone reductase-like Zn-dependent oxidoreductase